MAVCSRTKEDSSLSRVLQELRSRSLGSVARHICSGGADNCQEICVFPGPAGNWLGGFIGWLIYMKECRFLGFGLWQ